MVPQGAQLAAGGVGLIVLLGIIGSAADDLPTDAAAGSESSATNTPTPAKRMSAREVCRAAQLAVMNVLKAPATAKFRGDCNSVGPALEAETQDMVWMVDGQVDSQNGFGALVRGTYIVTIRDLGDHTGYKSNIIAIETR